jgi:hypothetical protein
VVRLKTTRNHSRLGTDRNWPDYELYVKGAPATREECPDRSMADFFWCLMAIVSFMKSMKGTKQFGCSTFADLV